MNKVVATGKRQYGIEVEGFKCGNETLLREQLEGKSGFEVEPFKFSNGVLLGEEMKSKFVIKFEWFKCGNGVLEGDEDGRVIFIKGTDSDASIGEMEEIAWDELESWTFT